MMLYVLATIGGFFVAKKFWHWAGSHPEQARQAELDRQRRLEQLTHRKD